MSEWIAGECQWVGSSGRPRVSLSLLSGFCVHFIACIELLLLLRIITESLCFCVVFLSQVKTLKTTEF